MVWVVGYLIGCSVVVWMVVMPYECRCDRGKVYICCIREGKLHLNLR